MASTSEATVKIGTFRTLRYSDLKPNPLNPRRVFDRIPLDILKDNIRRNGILVPLTVYKDERGQHYIVDGERRWRCAEEIENDPNEPKRVPIPVNVIDKPTKVANILAMFNIHNLREQWELMPTALGLQVLMKELKESDDQKLAALTELSPAHVRRCKILLSYDKKYHQMMLDPNTDSRVKANFFIEIHPVLDLYMKLGKTDRANKTRDELIEHFLNLYRKNKIASVINFRRILEAHDILTEDDDRYDEFRTAMRALASSSNKKSIRQLFDPLVSEDKSVQEAEVLCADFLKRLKRLKIEHTTKQASLRKTLVAIQKYLDDLLAALETR